VVGAASVTGFLISSEEAENMPVELLDPLGNISIGKGIGPQSP